MLGAQRLVSETQLVERARSKVLDENVCPRNQLVQQSSALRVLEVQREAFLVSVDAQEVRTFAVYKRRTPRTRVVAEPRPLDLDDSGAHVRELHGAVGSGEHPAEIQDGDPLEGERVLWNDPRRKCYTVAPAGNP